MANKGSKKKVESDRTDWLTIRENEMLSNLKKVNNIRIIANDMGISYTRAERILANIRNKWELSVNTHNRLLGLTRRDPYIRRILSKTTRKGIPKPKQEENGEEDDEPLKKLLSKSAPRTTPKIQDETEGSNIESRRD